MPKNIIADDICRRDKMLNRRCFGLLIAGGIGAGFFHGCGGGESLNEVDNVMGANFESDGNSFKFYTHNSGNKTRMLAIESKTSNGFLYFIMDENENLVQIVNYVNNIIIDVVNYFDRVEYRSYDFDGLFKTGLVVFSEKSELYQAEFFLERYELAALQRNILHKNELTALVAKNWFKLALDFIPLSGALADEVNDTGVAMLVGTGALTVTDVFLPMSVGFILLLGLTLGPLEAAAAVAVALVLASKKAKAASVPFNKISPKDVPVVKMGKNNLEIGLGKYVGSYSGTYMGDDADGDFSVRIDSIGRISGFSSDGAVVGTVSKGNFAATVGSVANGATFSGKIDTRYNPYKISGTWQNTLIGKKGTFSGGGY